MRGSSSMPYTLTGHFTCDNCYAVYTGTANEVTVKHKEETNTLASQIWQGESVTFQVSDGDYLYLIAWSDDTTMQGLIGSFTVNGETIHTGDEGWEVLATGHNLDSHEYPDKNQINTFIANSTPPDWLPPFAGAINNPPEGKPYRSKIADIPDEARWVWHDSNQDARNKYPQRPYVPFSGFDHNEFLIFRIPISKFTPEAPMSEDKKTCCCCCQPVVVNCPPPKEETPPPKEEKKCCSTCAFEVRLQRWRYISGKPGWLDGNAELTFTSHIDGNMHNYPSRNGSYVFLGKRGGKYWDGWQASNVRVTTMEVPCKGKRVFDLMVEMQEHPKSGATPIPTMLEGENPWGVSEVSEVQLRCSEKPKPLKLQVQLTSSGNKTEDLKIEVEYRFSQITTCTCCD